MAITYNTNVIKTKPTVARILSTTTKFPEAILGSRAVALIPLNISSYSFLKINLWLPAKFSFGFIV